MNFDLNELKDKVKRYSDDELIGIITINASSYREEMIEIATAELEKRGISLDEQQIIFNVEVNSDNYAGRLILIGEELLFLSTGMSANHASRFGGLAGLLVHESRAAARSIKSQTLDFTAIDNKGSWAYFIDEITKCDVSSSWLSAKALNVKGIDQNGNAVAHSINNDDFSGDDFTKLKLQIEEAKNKLGKGSK